MYGPSLYSQTPGAFHMGGGYSTAQEYRDPFLGTAMGYSSHGDALMRGLGAMPSTALTVGSGAAALSSLGIGGGGMRFVGNTLGFGGLGMFGGMGAGIIAGEVAKQFARATDQQVFAQNALNQVVGNRDQGGAFGFGASREAATGFAKMFRELSSSTEMLTGDQELKNLFSKFNDMSLFQSVRDAAEVGTRFKKLAETVRDISRDLGTTMEGVLPMFRQQLQMGFTDPDQIRSSMRMSKATTSVGVGSNQETVTSLQMTQSAANFAAGGNRSLGAQGALKSLGTINVALEQGVLTDADLMSATGQIGQKGAADLAQQLMQASRRVMSGDSAYGRMLSGFLGEVDEQGFTGRIDQRALNRLGRLSMDEIQQEFQRKMRGNEVSFEARMKAGMGADISSQMGAGEFSQMLDKIFTEQNAHSDDLKQLVLQQLIPQMRGQTIRQLLKLQKNANELEATAAQQTASAIIRNRLPSLFEERFSIGASFARGGRMVERSTFTPLANAFGAGLGNLGRDLDNLQEDIYSGGMLAGAKSLFTGDFVGERIDSIGNKQSGVSLALQGLGGTDLRATDESMRRLSRSGGLLGLGDGDRQQFDQLLGSSAQLNKSFRFRGAGGDGQKALSSIMRLLAENQGMSDTELVTAFLENQDDERFFGRSTDSIELGGGLRSFLRGILDKPEHMILPSQRKRVQGMIDDINTRASTLLTLGNDFGADTKELLGENKGILSSMFKQATRGAGTGAVVAGMPTFGAGALGGAVVGFGTGLFVGLGEGLMSDDGLLQEDDAFGGADFEGEFLQSSFLRNLVKTNPTEAMALIQNVLTKRHVINDFLAAKTEKEKIEILKKNGIRNANATTVAGVADLVRAMTDEYGTPDLGVSKSRRLLNRIRDGARSIAIKKMKDRASDILVDTLDTQLEGVEGAATFKTSLRDIYAGRGTAKSLAGLNLEEMLERVGPNTSAGRALSSFFQMTQDAEGEFDTTRLGESLMGMARTKDEKSRIKRLIEAKDIGALMQTALSASLQNVDQVEDLSPQVRAAKRLGNVGEVAEIIADVSRQLSRDLAITQKNTLRFQDATTTKIKSMDSRLPN